MCVQGWLSSWDVFLDPSVSSIGCSAQSSDHNIFGALAHQRVQVRGIDAER